MKIPQHRTKIVCTLGPATDRPGVLEKMLLGGMDVARLNAAHGAPGVHRKRIRTARQIAQRLGVPLAILLDLPGPKHRLGRLPVASLELRRGKKIFLGSRFSGAMLPVSDPRFLRDLKSGDPIYLADGTVRLRVLRRLKAGLECRIEIGGAVRSGSGLNMPLSDLSVKLPTPQDRQWIEFASREEVDWLGISFVRTAQDVRRVRRFLKGRRHRPYLLAKIEKREALENLGAIADAANGLMVARGDLGVETPLESVPMAQKRIILEGLHKAKPVITATQMLESMVEEATPTRAEVADVANAVLDGTDAVMLSAETAIGAHPVAAVHVLNRILREAEASYPYELLEAHLSRESWENPVDAVSLVACRLANDQKVQAIVVAPGTQASSWSLARFRPRSIIFKIMHSPKRAQPQNLLWSVWPVRVPKRKGGMKEVLALLRRQRRLRPSAPVVFIHASPGTDSSDLIQIVRP
jgi:pyruvate kinase